MYYDFEKKNIVLPRGYTYQEIRNLKQEVHGLNRQNKSLNLELQQLRQ